MYGYFRPVTYEFHIHETYILPKAAEKVIEFQEKGEPILIWSDHWRSDLADKRNVSLTIEERERIMLGALALCGLSEDFHSNVKILKKDRSVGNTDILWVNETTFGNHRPSIVQIFNWLGDYGVAARDDINDFDVGFALDSPEGLAVIRYSSFEEDDDFREEEYQIALYPKDKITDINWYANHYSSAA